MTEPSYPPGSYRAPEPFAPPELRREPLAGPYRPAAPPAARPGFPPEFSAELTDELADLDRLRRRRRRRRRLLVTGGTALLVAAAITINRIDVDRQAGGKGLAAPTSFDGYTKLDNDASRSLVSRLQGATGLLGVTGSTSNHAMTIAVYAKNTGDQPALVALMIHTSDLAPGEADAFANGVFGSYGTALSYPSGALGGAMQCATLDQAADQSTCSWSDANTSGAVVSIYPPTEPPALAGVAVALRTALS